MGVYPIFRPLLFALDPETAHRGVSAALRTAARFPGFTAAERALFGYEHPALRLEIWGQAFTNPIGLAAGFDKDGTMIEPLLGLGFGTVEVGTVTPLPQPGNPRPRLFRLPQDEALINRMGFNNAGAEALARRLERLRGRAGPIGVNLGKNRETPLERAAEDYVRGMRAVYLHADYLAVNVSSPNTPGLRDLQDAASLQSLMAALHEARTAEERATGRRVPLLVKVSPDLDEAGLTAFTESVLETEADGLIVANTTLRREGLRSPVREEEGGLSGRPLFAVTLDRVGRLRQLTGGRMPLVAAGGVFGAEEAYALIRAGASLVQIYTALVYRGPGVVKAIKRGLVQLLQRDGFARIADAVGTAGEPGSRSTH